MIRLNTIAVKPANPPRPVPRGVCPRAARNPFRAPRRTGVISRVLCSARRRMGSSVWDPDHSGPLAAYPGLMRDRRPHSPLFGLAPDGVCRATPVARRPVRSYRTLSPLPVPRSRGHRRSALCCTFRHLAVPGRYPASCLAELGLSSARRVLWGLPAAIPRPVLLNALLESSPGRGAVTRAGSPARCRGSAPPQVETLDFSGNMCSS